MVDDAIDLVDAPFFDRARLLEVLERRIREEQGQKSNINTTNNSKLQLNRDLNYILHSKPLRRVGEMPQKLGGFTRIAPSDASERLFKLVKSYKVATARDVNNDGA
jgi:tubulin polyglutamylase TTLL5